MVSSRRSAVRSAGPAEAGAAATAGRPYRGKESRAEAMPAGAIAAAMASSREPTYSGATAKAVPVDRMGSATNVWKLS
jgi:hypothetical protein